MQYIYIVATLTLNIPENMQMSKVITIEATWLQVKSLDMCCSNVSNS